MNALKMVQAILMKLLVLTCFTGAEVLAYWYKVLAYWSMLTSPNGASDIGGVFGTKFAGTKAQILTLHDCVECPKKTGGRSRSRGCMSRAIIISVI